MSDEQQNSRVRVPQGEETIGVLDQRLGASRSKVRCLDGNTRICRIPGRMKRYLWVREKDTVLVEPWELGGDEKGDIIYKYRPHQVRWLQKNGYLDDLQEIDDEF